MNGELLKNNYLVIPSFINPEHAKELEKEFHLTDLKYKFPSDEQAPNSSSVYNYLPALELLANKTSHVSEIVGETVLPTYVYSRIYRNGSVLTKHTDRPSCEISLTLHLGGDKPWAIWIETPEKEKRCVTLNPGDAMLYLGCIAPHWRDKFIGKNYTQFFLHYVRSRGCCSPVYFDKGRETVGDLEDLLEEYEKMSGFENTGKNVILPRKFRENRNSSFGGTIEIENVTETKEDYIDFDEVVVVNKKYEKFLTKKETPDIISDVESNKLSRKSLEDFIFYGQEAIDPEFCDDILDEYVDTDYWEPTLTGSGHDPSARRCSFICISDQGIMEEDNVEQRKQIDEKLFEIVASLIDEYQKKNPEFELEIQEDSGYELLKYEEGDFYVQHSDSFKQQPRALTVIISMNDNYDGGEVALFNRELVYKMSAGDVLIFPSNFMYPHEIMPVTSGTRYSLITWVV